MSFSEKPRLDRFSMVSCISESSCRRERGKFSCRDVNKSDASVCASKRNQVTRPMVAHAGNGCLWIPVNLMEQEGRSEVPKLGMLADGRMSIRCGCRRTLTFPSAPQLMTVRLRLSTTNPVTAFECFPTPLAYPLSTHSIFPQAQ